MAKSRPFWSAWLLAMMTLAAGPALAQSSPSPFTTGYRYDAAGQETGIISPDPDGAGPLPFPAARKTWDPAGRLVKVEEGYLTGWQSETVLPEAWSGFFIDQRRRQYVRL
jgi:YD repeat-containing protein